MGKTTGRKTDKEAQWHECAGYTGRLASVMHPHEKRANGPYVLPSARRSNFWSLFNFHSMSFESILHTHVTRTVYENKMNLSVEVFI